MEEPRLGVRFVETQFRATLTSTQCAGSSQCPREPILPSVEPPSEAAMVAPLVPAGGSRVRADTPEHRREVVA